MKKLSPHGYHKTDKEGRPIYIDLISKAKITELFELADEKTLIRYFVQGYERCRNVILPACSEERGQIVQDTVAIVDADGLGVSMLYGQVKQLVDLSSNVAQNYYPETLNKMIVINTSFMFSMLWSLVKGLLDKKTRDKVKMRKSDYIDELIKHVSN